MTTRAVPVPSTGRMVVYHSFGTPRGEYLSAQRAALITAVDHPFDPFSPVSLTVFNPTGVFFSLSVPYGETPGCWSWPKFVPPVEIDESLIPPDYLARIVQQERTGS